MIADNFSKTNKYMHDHFFNNENNSQKLDSIDTSLKQTLPFIKSREGYNNEKEKEKEKGHKVDQDYLSVHLKELTSKLDKIMDEIVIIQNKDNKKYNESPDIIDLSIDNYNEEIIDKLKLIENKLEKMHIEKLKTEIISKIDKHFSQDINVIE
eukprot:CAMPEP_0116939018 /NCGR_PEP_ID=MMETSP0467-20121206/32483_1 /TAXON_ID=283647 /ORGANISM="Mesodinium pulex, Strain SPMC105" /LENGTH=152 /DNA_ID=CAMNT_0004621211 /DNA_START=994 /DNA_END=1452 /DNA_ORIENTATION=+